MLVLERMPWKWKVESLAIRGNLNGQWYREEILEVPVCLIAGTLRPCQQDTGRRKRGATQKQVPISVLKAAVLHEWISQHNRQTCILLKTNDVS